MEGHVSTVTQGPCDLIDLAWHPVCASVHSASSAFTVLSTVETRAGTGPFRPEAVGIADAQLPKYSILRTSVLLVLAWRTPPNIKLTVGSVFVPQSTT